MHGPRRRARYLISISLGAIAAITPAATRSTAAPTDAPPMRVAVSIAPLRGLVEPMLPAGSIVTVLLPPSRSPHGMELTPSTVHDALAADILFYLGPAADPAATPLAAARRRHAAPSVSVLHTDDHDDHDHHHDHDHEHDAANLEHAWLDPAMVADFIPRARAAIEAALESAGLLDDSQRRRIASAEAAIQRDVAAVASAYEVSLPILRGRPVVSLHGALDAHLRSAGAEVARPLLIGHAAEPSPRTLHEALSRAQSTPGGVIVLIDSPAPPRFAALLEHTKGVHIARIDPITRDDWSRMMRDNLHALLLAASPGLTSPRE